MTDNEQIEALYQTMYRAMIAKDRQTLAQIHDDSFVLIHMTGLRQSKQDYIDSILDGTLNYYGKTDDGIDVRVHGEIAEMTGRSRVTASVFGGGKHTWRLALRFTLQRRPDGWKLTSASASTY